MINFKKNKCIVTSANSFNVEDILQKVLLTGILIALIV